jgi:ubiquinone/menaquinone biosynthesis C-methylase UbiE
MSRKYKLSDQEYLLADHYKDASNLNARIELHRRFSTNKQGWNRWVFDQLNLPPECRILELGCGPGDLWRENLDRVPAGWEITLTDFSAGMLQQAQENLADSGRYFEFEIVDAQSIPYDDGSFDAIIANHMLYHVPDRAKALGEMRRVLKAGGRFCTSTVGLGHMREMYEIIDRFDSDKKLQHTAPPFTLESGQEQLAPWFSQVTLRRYEDDLVITDAELLVAYILSLADARSVFVDDKLIKLIEYLEQEIAAHGSVHITKDSGMFEAF